MNLSMEVDNNCPHIISIIPEATNAMIFLARYIHVEGLLR